MVINYKSLKDHIYKYLYEKINNGSLKPREKLDENQLCKDLKVSRTPIREALIQLEDEGYVERLPRRGFIVKEITLDKIKEIFEIIGCLEGMAGAMAIEKIKEKDISLLSKLINKMDESIKNRKLLEYFSLQRNFHNVILSASGNTELTNLISSLKKRFLKKAYFGRQDDDALYKRLRKNNDEHKHIFKLLEEGDKTGIEKLLREVHWNTARAEMIVSPFESQNVTTK